MKVAVPTLVLGGIAAWLLLRSSSARAADSDMGPLVGPAPGTPTFGPSTGPTVDLPSGVAAGFDFGGIASDLVDIVDDAVAADTIAEMSQREYMRYLGDLIVAVTDPEGLDFDTERWDCWRVWTFARRAGLELQRLDELLNNGKTRSEAKIGRRITQAEEALAQWWSCVHLTPEWLAQVARRRKWERVIRLIIGKGDAHVNDSFAEVGS